MEIVTWHRWRPYTRFIFNARVIARLYLMPSACLLCVNHNEFFFLSSSKMAFQFYFLGHLQIPLNVESFLISAWLRSTGASGSRCVHRVYLNAEIPLNSGTAICGRYNDALMSINANNNEHHRHHHRKGWKKNAESGTWILNDVWVFIFIDIS